MPRRKANEKEKKVTNTNAQAVDDAWYDKFGERLDIKQIQLCIKGVVQKNLVGVVERLDFKPEKPVAYLTKCFSAMLARLFPLPDEQYDYQKQLDRRGEIRQKEDREPTRLTFRKRE